MADDSRVLIVEQALTNPPTARAATADVLMSTLGGKERTVEMFQVLAMQAGLTIVQVYPSPDSDYVVIECMKRA